VVLCLLLLLLELLVAQPLSRQCCLAPSWRSYQQTCAQQQQQRVLLVQIGCLVVAEVLKPHLLLLTAAAVAAAAGVLGQLLLPGQAVACHLRVQKRVRPCEGLSRAPGSVLLLLLLLLGHLAASAASLFPAPSIDSCSSSSGLMVLT
jgi:hypothetical protein